MAAKKTKKTSPAKKKTPAARPLSKRILAKKNVQDARPLPSLILEDGTASEIVRRLREALSPSHLSIQNLTKAHAKHKTKGAGGHYVVRAVSELFEGLNRMQREKWVSTLVTDLLGQKIHALSMELKAPSEIEGVYKTV